MSLPEKATIAVIDDDEVTLTSLRTLLEGAGHSVIALNRAAGSVAVILQKKPQLALIDVCLPKTAGDTLVKMIRAAAPTLDCTLILHSVLDEPLLRAKARAAGADGHLKKGCSPRTLLANVRRWLASRAASSESSSRPLVPARGVRRDSTRILERMQLSRLAASSDASGTRRALPRAPGGENAPPVHTATPACSGVHAMPPPVVLLVDHDMAALSTYRSLLQGQWCQLDFALSGAQALRLIRSASPPSVVIAELELRDLTGADLLGEALACDSSWGSRFVFVSDMDFLPARRLLGGSFPGVLLRKPVEGPTLRQTLRTLVSQPRGRPQCVDHAKR